MTPLGVEQQHATLDSVVIPALLPVSHRHLVAGGWEPAKRGRRVSERRPISGAHAIMKREPRYGASSDWERPERWLWGLVSWLGD